MLLGQIKSPIKLSDLVFLAMLGVFVGMSVNVVLEVYRVYRQALQQ